MTKEVINTAVERVDDEFHELLKKRDLWKVLRIGAWINRVSEIKMVKKWWIKRAQGEARSQPSFVEENLELNLQENDEHILECRERIRGFRGTA